MSALITVVPASMRSVKFVGQEFAIDLDVVGTKITDEAFLAGLDAQCFDDGTTFGFEISRSALAGLTDQMGRFTAVFTGDSGQRFLSTFEVF